jgi:hypothetical protein
LECVLASAEFSRNERLSRFLRLVVERHLEGRDRELKETVIGLEVFGRSPGYDPRQDSIVRTEAIRLRARLEKYYSSEGRADPVIIQIPKGGYTAVFRIRDTVVDHWAWVRPPVKRFWAGIALAGIAAVLGATSFWARSQTGELRSEDESDPVRLVMLGRVNEAIEQARAAWKAAPHTAEAQLNLAWVLTSAERYDEAAGYCYKVASDHPKRKACLARAWLGLGRFSDVIELLAGQTSGYLGYAYARTGRRDEAEKVAAATRSRFHQALVFAGLGDKERVLEALEHEPDRQLVAMILVYPELSLLRGDPRVRELRARLGLGR